MPDVYPGLSDMTRRRALYAKMLAYGIGRSLLLLVALGLILDVRPEWQLLLLPPAIVLFLARHAFGIPLFPGPRQIDWRTRCARAREVSAFLLRPPTDAPRFVLSIIIVAAMVPFTWGLFGSTCAQGGSIRVGFDLGNPGDADLGPVGQFAVVFFRLSAFVILEEFAFRAWLLGPLRKLLGTTTAVVITSYLFALVHFRPGTFVNDLFNGTAFGLGAVLSGSLWTAVGMHFAYNIALVGWEHYIQMGGPGTISCAGVVPISLFLISALIYVLSNSRKVRPDHR